VVAVRVKAAGHAPCPAVPRPWFSRSLSASPRGAISLRARRGRPSTRHGDEHAEPCRAPLRRSLAPSALLSSLPFASQTSPLPLPPLSSLLQAPGRAFRGVQSRRCPPFAPPLPRPSRSSLLRPSSCPTDPTASSLTLRWCSPTRSPTPKPAGTPPPQAQSAAGRPSPRRRPLRPSRAQPRPPLGPSRPPLAPPPIPPRRRPP